MAKKKREKPDVGHVCAPMTLPEDALWAAAVAAVDESPANAPAGVLPAERIAVLATKFWGARVADLTVGFVERPSQAMMDKVLAIANRWGAFSAARFRQTNDLSQAVVRISFGGGGYWSYIGTDNLQIPANRQTMNLEGFSLNTSESEWLRVVQHEFGHALGCPHEHARPAVVDLLDPRKVINYFSRTQGWDEQTIREQILTPLDERSFQAGSSPAADQSSIMAYSFPGSLTRNGRPVPGGNDFSPTDKTYFNKLYPGGTVKPPPPPEGKVSFAFDFDPVSGVASPVKVT